MGETIEFRRPDGGKAPAYYAAPGKDAQPAPGVVVVQEWWGVTPLFIEIADRYAQNGFRALVPDLFRGRRAAKGDEGTHLMEGLDFQDAFSQDVRGALQYLKQSGTKTGVTGYCMGGALTLLAAMHLKEPDAAVVFYGLPPPDAGDPGSIKIPIMLHFSERDEFVKSQAVHTVEQRMKAGNVPYQLYWYDARHGFCNPNQPGNAGLGNYNEAACIQAWSRTLNFFKRELA